MPPGLCERVCCTAETAVVRSATKWTATCRALGLRGEASVFRTKSDEEMKCLLKPMSVGGPTLHGTRGVLVYHESDIGLSG